MTHDNVSEIPTAKALTPEQKACVDLIRQALTEATAGRVDGVAVVLLQPTGIAPALAGTRPGDLMLGLEACKARILQATFPPSSIIRPGR